MDQQRHSRDLADHLIELGIKVRVLAIAVEGLGRQKRRSRDGIAISAMLLQLSDEIADLSEMIIPLIGAADH
jgi:hypothetical protein